VDMLKIFKAHNSSTHQLDFSSMPDVSMTGMIVAACTPGVWRFTGLESLRVKECDRIAAMAEGLEKLGVNVEVEGDEVIIEGKREWGIGNREKIIIDARDDHRIAMCFGILRDALDLDFEITDLHCVAKSWPSFWEDLADWSGKLRPVSAVIVKKQDEYLIVRKPRDEHAWQFPQGGVDIGESLLQAAERELKEECGEDLQVKFLGKNYKNIYKYLFPENFIRHDENITGAKVHFFEAEYVSGDVEVDGEEIVEAKWVKAEELENYFEEDYLGLFQSSSMTA